MSRIPRVLQTTGTSIMEGVGPQHMWGFSPALDLQATYYGAGGAVPAVPSAAAVAAAKAAGKKKPKAAPLRVLVVGGGDIRHVLRTLASRRRHPARPLHVYVFDGPVEALARHLLLLQIVHDWEVPLRHRANTFLEVYGNALVQERTEAYIAEKGAQLVDFVCNDKGPLRGLVDVSLLKFRHRDELEKALLGYGARVPFDARALREKRLRLHFGSRYDVRRNSVDWDYQMGVKTAAGASIIHYKQYMKWRLEGIAFEFGDQTYTMPNRSTATYAAGREQGLSKLRRGYWLDIVVGPYLGFGIDAERTNQHARDLFKVQNKGTGSAQHRHTSAHVAIFNLLAYMHEIETGKRYRMRQADQVYSGLGKEDRKLMDRLRKEDEADRKKEEAAKAAEAAAAEGEAEAGGPAAEGGGGGDDAKKAAAESGGGDALVDAAWAAGEEAERAAEAAREEAAAREKARNILRTRSGMKVHLLTGDPDGHPDTPGGWEGAELRRKRYRGKFDMVYLGAFQAQLLKHPALREALNLAGNGGAADKAAATRAAADGDGVVVVVETAKHFPPLKKAQKQNFLNATDAMVRELAKAQGRAAGGGVGFKATCTNATSAFVDGKGKKKKKKSLLDDDDKPEAVCALDAENELPHLVYVLQPCEAVAEEEVTTDGAAKIDAAVAAAAAEAEADQQKQQEADGGGDGGGDDGGGIIDVAGSGSSLAGRKGCVREKKIKEVVLCEVCREQPYKYRCPKSGCKTCSLKCSKAHKLDPRWAKFHPAPPPKAEGDAEKEAAAAAAAAAEKEAADEPEYVLVEKIRGAPRMPPKPGPKIGGGGWMPRPSGF